MCITNTSELTLPTLPHRVPMVFGLGTQGKMLWIDTWRIIAGMHDYHPNGYLSIIVKLPSYPMSCITLIVDPEGSIMCSGLESLPDPASERMSDLVDVGLKLSYLGL